MSSWDDATRLLRDADEVALACHVSPDGDALGSMLALGLALRSLGKRPLASWGSRPFAVPARYAYLPTGGLLTDPDDFPEAPDLLVTFDTGSVERLGTLRAGAEKAGTLVVVDHHPSNTRYGDVHLVDPTAAATAVLVAALVDRLGVPLDADIATCLYTGLSTDTGSFTFGATTPDVHALAGRLLATGIDHDAIARSIWDTNRFGYLRLLGEVLGRAVLEPRLVWTWVSADDLARHGVTLDEVEGVIDVLRTAAEAEVAVVCKQEPGGRYAVSLRCKGRVDVGAVATALGGGGHRLAAGFTSDADVPATIDRIREML
jgi:phosphoesterase RecJ-like protein